MVDTIERTKDIQFAKGFNPEIECIRLSLDPVIASYRPLIHYGVGVPRCAMTYCRSLILNPASPIFFISNS